MERDATWAYRDRFGDAFARTYFRRFGPGVVSSIGSGTYLGDADDATDERYRRTIRRALESGVNLVDTAATYRRGRSERAAGEALAAADVEREAVCLATKGGFVPFGDGTDPAAGVRDVAGTGAVDPGEVVGGNCIAPAFLDAMVDRSLSALNVDAVDCYYVHEPETQLDERPRAAVYDALEAAFERLERRVAAGDVGRYGVATWEAFRVPPDHPRYLSLPEVVSRARAAADAAGRETTGLGAIQLPFNVRMADAFTVAAHEGPEGVQSALEFCHEAGLSVFASAPLGGGDLAAAGAVPEAVDARLAGDSPVQRAINFARSAPAVTSALVGTTDADHLDEDVAAGTFEPMGAAAFDATFE